VIGQIWDQALADYGVTAHGIAEAVAVILPDL
jgi:hypothetical protein